MVIHALVGISRKFDLNSKWNFMMDYCKKNGINPVHEYNWR